MMTCPESEPRLAVLQTSDFAAKPEKNYFPNPKFKQRFLSYTELLMPTILLFSLLL